MLRYMYMKAKVLLLSILGLVLAGSALAAEPVSLNQPQAPVAADRPSLTATATADPTTVTSGQTVTLSVTITNTGTAIAKQVQVTYATPTGFVLVPARTSNRWSMGDLAVGQAKSLNIKLSSTTASGRYPNEITISATNADAIQTLAPFDITAPQVLGASDTNLAVTGGAARDAVFPLVGSLMIAAGWLILRRLPTN